MSYERYQISSLLRRDAPLREHAGALYLAPRDPAFAIVFDAAVAPAFRASGMGRASLVPVFGSETALAEVCGWVRAADLVVADLTSLSPDLMYVLGLCHGLGRCPIQIVQRGHALPFDLRALRTIEYTDEPESLRSLRDQLTRAVRTLLAANRAAGDWQSGQDRERERPRDPPEAFLL